MPTVTKEIRLILSEVDGNANKFWTGQLFDNGDVQTIWGRVGYSPQSKIFRGAGDHFLSKKHSEKIRKGYSELRTVSTTDSVKNTVVKNDRLAEIARKQIAANPRLSSLIDRLVASNIHHITSSTQISFNKDTGLFSTPLGIVTPDGISEARNILANIKRYFDQPQQVRPLVSQYLRIIPHNVGMRFDVADIFPDNDVAIQRENDTLDQLESSYAALGKTKPVIKDDKPETEEKIFSVSMDFLESSDNEYDAIVAWFAKTNKAMHHYTGKRVHQIYKVVMDTMEAEYDAKLGNHTRVWHGTSQANLLSILKSGLKVSPPSTAYIAGKMFGNGIYGSQTASKSLGYTFGRWGGATSDSGWLFVCDFAMGNAYYPKSYGFSSLPHGYHSCWALPANTGLHNDELIVYRNNQVRIKYLLEIK